MVTVAREPEERTVLRTHALSIGYGNVAVARGLELALVAGELVCLLGPNGAGKSTLIRTLSGLESPLAGDIALDGVPLSRLRPRERARKLAVILTDRAMTGLMTGYELVALGRHPYTGWGGHLSADDHAIVRRALHLTGAEPFATRAVADLSDGERQRVMLARALAQQPRILILDEVTAFLDLPRRIQVVELLRSLARNEGIAVLLSCHDLELAVRHADRLWLLAREGRFAEGTARGLIEDGRLARLFESEGLVLDERQLRATAELA